MRRQPGRWPTARRRAVTMFSDGTTDYLVSLSSDIGAEEWRLTLDLRVLFAYDAASRGLVFCI